LGYSVQGNEFSLYMLLASDFILNGGIATPDRPLEMAPWLMESTNSHSSADRCRIVQIPDVDPLDIMDYEENETPVPQFSMAAGDFQSIYSNPGEVGQWDCVCSCFFLDACPNIVETIQLIHKMLKPGGYLVNFGPLLYHWSGPIMRPDDKSAEDYQNRFTHVDQRYMRSVDLTYEDVKEMLINVGFEIVEEQTGIKCLYTADRRSMQNMVYRCVSFVARKLPTSEGSTSTSNEEMTG
jgi:carnosine N-methyltransferase